MTSGTTSARESLPFDEIILTEGQAPRVLPAGSFFEMPLAVRLRHVIARTVVFVKRGVEVDPQEALAKVRAMRVGAPSTA